MYRVYLRDAHQQVSEKTVTGDPAAAAAAFAALADRRDLDGQRVTAVITRNGSPIAHHRFTSQENDQMHYWRGRTCQLPIYPEAGRPAEMEGGRRINVYLDADSINAATRLGDGNVSAGIRLAIRRAAGT